MVSKSTRPGSLPFHPTSTCNELHMQLSSRLYHSYTLYTLLYTLLYTPTMHMRTTADNFTLSHLLILEFCSILVSPLRKIRSELTLCIILLHSLYIKFVTYANVHVSTKYHCNYRFWGLWYFLSSVIVSQVSALCVYTSVIKIIKGVRFTGQINWSYTAWMCIQPCMNMLRSK